MSPVDFIGRKPILPREPIDFIDWKRRFQRRDLENAEEIDIVKEQSLVSHVVRFTRSERTAGNWGLRLAGQVGAASRLEERQRRRF